MEPKLELKLEKELWNGDETLYTLVCTTSVDGASIVGRGAGDLLRAPNGYTLNVNLALEQQDSAKGVTDHVVHRVPLGTSSPFTEPSDVLIVWAVLVDRGEVPVAGAKLDSGGTSTPIKPDPRTRPFPDAENPW